ncbi:type I DNA topoisomerase [Blattabacterium cuenoti]|uniref:type I DNA topoisomerase n=1 Tax=Blattabacterium cuenoti TaxID=1653831 RepID=UPI00163C8E13|nr:type I DNA topoisomerase [Blattabacterium cuenoti]
MKKNLVIVESPTKANTIQLFLGKEFYVVSSYGHLIDLPEKKIGIDIKKNFMPNYVILSKKRKIVQNLKTLIKDFNLIWLASDEDREGEAIAYQIYKILNIPSEKFRRIVFHEITKKAILHAIKNPRLIDYNLVHAQQARRILDRLVGFQLSPILWKKINAGLSAGRVQSAALRLIVEREKNIQNFIPNSGYQIFGIFTNKNKITINAKLEKKIEGEIKMKKILQSCIDSSFFIKKIVTKQEKKTPPPPFTTASLQQEACKKLNFSISKTMFLAQKLYEKGYITYIRTDSTSLSKDILSEIKNYILSSYGKSYFSPKEFLSKKKFSQEAHEAIHPTDIGKNSLEDLDTYEKILYKFIWERTIIGQMTDANIEKKNFYIQSSNFEISFVFTEKTIIFDGFMKIYGGDNLEKKETNLSKIQKGTLLQKEKITAKQIFTKHLPRYNEASLVKNLEKLGIGRPSTYVPIISTIQKRNYVNLQKSIKKKEYRKSFILNEKNIIIEKKNEITEIEKNKFIPTEIGILTTNFLKKNFHEIVDYDFTANLEKEFDNIAKGEVSWKKIIKNFYDGFHKKIEYVEKNVEKVHKKRFLGIDPISKKKIFSQVARFGPIVQMGEFKNKEKPKFSPLLISQKIDTISLKIALKLLELPKSLGVFEEEEVLLRVNKYNVYIRHKNKSIPIEEKMFFNSFHLKDAIDVIKKNRKK